MKAFAEYIIYMSILEYIWGIMQEEAQNHQEPYNVCSIVILEYHKLIVLNIL